jgi:hypothetical protein
MVLSVLKDSKLLVPKNHQRLISSIMDAYHEGGSRGRGVVHSADMMLSSTSELLIENHMHFPLVVFVA